MPAMTFSIFPLPPPIAIPPNMTIAKIQKSHSSIMYGEVAPTSPMKIKPLRPAIVPASVWTRSLIFPTFIPIILAASDPPPIAYILTPILVWFKISHMRITIRSKKTIGKLISPIIFLPERRSMLLCVIHKVPGRIAFLAPINKKVVARVTKKEWTPVLLMIRPLMAPKVAPRIKGRRNRMILGASGNQTSPNSTIKTPANPPIAGRERSIDPESRQIPIAMARTPYPAYTRNISTTIERLKNKSGDKKINSVYPAIAMIHVKRSNMNSWIFLQFMFSLPPFLFIPLLIY